MRKNILFIYLGVIINFLTFNVGSCLDLTESEEIVTTTRKILDTNSINLALFFQDQKEVHLSFFWASGFSKEDLKSEYGALHQINIHSPKESAIFFLQLEEFLNIMPEGLKINFIVDDLTYESNQVIYNFENKFFNRFKAIKIKEVTKNLKDVFPLYNDIIDTVFQNADHGTPVIVSDVYRLIGMPFLDLSKEYNYQKTVFTYCDIDTFIYCLRNMDKKKFLEILCAPYQHIKSKYNFEIGAPYKFRQSNDIIKLQIDKFDDYQNFCKATLNRLNGEFLSNYYPKVLDFINTNEKKIYIDFEKTYHEYQIHRQKNPFNHTDILYFAGPGFLQSYKTTVIDFNLLSFESDQSSFSWDSSFLIHPNNFQPYESIQSLTLSKFVPSVKNQNFNLTQDFVSCVRDAFYVKKLGIKHPFYLKLIEEINEKNPFYSSQMRILLNETYKFDCENGYNNTKETWLKIQMEKLQFNPSYSYTLSLGSPNDIKLEIVLEKLGIHFNLSYEKLLKLID